MAIFNPCSGVKHINSFFLTFNFKKLYYLNFLHALNPIFEIEIEIGHPMFVEVK